MVGQGANCPSDSPKGENITGRGVRAVDPFVLESTDGAPADWVSAQRGGASSWAVDARAAGVASASSIDSARWIGILRILRILGGGN